ncbi:hypothetical protein TRIP_E190098 [uncultured Spirochaetota bacterium]|uniref:Uncharacterized protein n=1 Tax=uncultured Spirochaetota bacterium TaxID=460511 RepID=A0A652ZTS5_9SPIR|nr:hypothetical protein TRIP_E190098 [uncultured Spirochaetota bacterium]
MGNEDRRRLGLKDNPLRRCPGNFSGAFSTIFDAVAEFFSLAPGVENPPEGWGAPDAPINLQEDTPCVFSTLAPSTSTTSTEWIRSSVPAKRKPPDPSPSFRGARVSINPWLWPRPA